MPKSEANLGLLDGNAGSSWETRLFLQKSLEDEIIFFESVRRIKRFREPGVFMEWRDQFDAFTRTEP